MGEQRIWITYSCNLNVVGIFGASVQKGHGMTSELEIMLQDSHCKMILFKICISRSRTNGRCTGILHASQNLLCDFYIKGCILMLDSNVQEVISGIPGLSF
jgi:hypothetical protein